MSPTAFFEKTIKKIFWKSLNPKTKPRGAFRFKTGMSVLALRPDRLGDFILSAPALQVLEEALGNTGRMTLVAGERNEALAQFFFPRAEILVFRKPFLKRLALFFRLRLRRFDLALDFHSYPFSTTSALLALCSGSPYRVGFWDNKSARGISRQVFNLGVSSPAENIHEMEKSFLLLKPLGLRLFRTQDFPFGMPAVPAGVRHRVATFYKKIGLHPQTILLAVHPTLLKEDNRWLLENYVELSRELSRLPRIKIIVVHGLGEGNRLQRFKELAAEIPNVFVLPENDVLFILEAAKRFDLLVCNDSGVMHLAALVTRVLAIFGPSEPERWGPLITGTHKPKILRGRDFQCDSVQVAKAVQEVKKMFRHRKPSAYR